MNVEILNTGTELLLGSVVNTHLPFFAHALFALGLRVARQSTVPDGEAIRQGVEEALARADVLLITGGLGPTSDDLTREMVAACLNVPLRRDPALVTAITQRFASRGIPMVESNLRQAELPEGGVALPNPHGTAPGIYLRHERPGAAGEPARTVHVFLLPGPPRELYPMFEQDVAPVLEKLAARALSGGLGGPCRCRTFHLLGLGESNVEALVGERLLAISGLELGYCARPGEVDVRCLGPEDALAAAEKILTEVLGDRIASRDGVKLEESAVATLTARGQTLATAESCTGGLLVHRITNVPGASAVLLAGYVTYSNEAKSVDLGVNPLQIETHGAVSAETAASMAEGALRRSGADWALATTGIAGPGGGTALKPVGTVFIALAHRGLTTRVESHHFNNRDRETFKHLAANAALDLLRRALGWNG